MNNGLFFLAYTHSPLHAGIGQAMGKVDLPIEREKHTTYPCIYATGFKGALKKYCENNSASLGISNGDVLEIFGESGASAGAGGAMFTDLKILLFPVRSSKDNFKWVTCPHVLKRFENDYNISGGQKDKLTNLPSKEPSNIIEATYEPNKHILLEDFLFEYKQQNENNFFLGIDEILVSDIYVIDDLLFKHLVNNATQIIARNVLDKNKTSKNLWYEETLPSDSVAYSFILPSVINSDKLSKLENLHKKICQIGGNETVGHGLTELYQLFNNSSENTKNEEEEK